MQALTFDPATESDSYSRSREYGARIDSTGPASEWVVWMNDSETPHIAAIVEDGDGYSGCCSCDGWQYHDGPCTHLWALRRADAWDVISIATVKDALTRPFTCPSCGNPISKGIYDK
jgi:hypothetical protein